MCVCVLCVFILASCEELNYLPEGYMLYTIQPADLLKFDFALAQCPLRSDGSHLFPWCRVRPRLALGSRDLNVNEISCLCASSLPPPPPATPLFKIIFCFKSAVHFESASCICRSVIRPVCT
jgi:hypothetical protein